MEVLLKNGQLISIRSFELSDASLLSHYLFQLSSKTRQRFAPHGYDVESIVELYRFPSSYIGFVVLNSKHEIIGYAVLKIGYLEHDEPRLKSYGLELSGNTDVTFAPSIADAWQSTGTGSALLLYIISAIQKLGIKRILLWGGVQANNETAVNYYFKHGFKTLGAFEYNGLNYDMMLRL